MKYLAIDTSSSYLTVVASDGDKVAIEYEENCALNHSVALMGKVEDSLEKISSTPSDIDVYACSVGPGSFTGIRIGVSTVKAFAYALKKKVLGVTSFETLAYSIEDRVKKLTLICARHGNYYAAAFDEDGNVVLPPFFVSAEKINQIKDGYLVIADVDADGLGAVIADTKKGFRAAVEAKLPKADDDGETLVPLYVKKSQAEEEA